MLNILKNYFGHLQPCKHCHLLYRRREFSRPMLFSVGQPKPSVSGENFSRGSGRMPPNTFQGNSDLAVADNEILKKAKVNPLLLKPFFDPILCKSTRNYFEAEVTVERLFDARVHLGHKVGTLNDNMKWALYGERLGVCVFDLNITREYMIKALEFVRSVAYSGGRFLFVTTNRSSMLMVEETAERIGQYAHTRKWRTGTFINVKGILGGPIRLPDTVIVLNTLTSAMERHPAVIEAAKMCIPTVAVVDSNCEPNYVTYPIPGNDDSIASTSFYMEMFVKAIQKGQEESRTVTGHEGKQQQQSRQSQQRRKSMDRTWANSERR